MTIIRAKDGDPEVTTVYHAKLATASDLYSISRLVRLSGRSEAETVANEADAQVLFAALGLSHIKATCRELAMVAVEIFHGRMHLGRWSDFPALVARLRDEGSVMVAVEVSGDEADGDTVIRIVEAHRSDVALLTDGDVDGFLARHAHTRGRPTTKEETTDKEQQDNT